MPVPVQRFFPAETYPEAQEALLRHYENAGRAWCARRPGTSCPCDLRARGDRLGLTPRGRAGRPREPRSPSTVRSGRGRGQILRTALALAAATGQGFEMTRIRAGRPRPGLRPQQVDGRARRGARLRRARGRRLRRVARPALRARPRRARATSASTSRTAGARRLVLQTDAGRAGDRRRSRAASRSPAARTSRAARATTTWRALGRDPSSASASRCSCSSARAGFYPPGGGEIAPTVEPAPAPSSAARVRRSAGRSSIRARVSGDARLKTPVAERQRDAAAERLWESRRWRRRGRRSTLPSDSPGSSFLLQATLSSTGARASASWPSGACGPRRSATGPRACCSSSSTARAPSTRTSPISSRCRSPSRAAAAASRTVRGLAPAGDGRDSAGRVRRSGPHVGPRRAPAALEVGRPGCRRRPRERFKPLL